MSQNQNNQTNKRVLFRLLKGFLYGNVIGLIFGISIFLLASAVNVIAVLPMNPSQIFMLIYGTSVVSGVSKEYSDWLDEQT